MATTASDLEKLYRRRYSAYRRGMTALTGSSEAARDVVQEAFAQALRDREQYRGDGSLERWVWCIAFRIAQQARRRGGREVTLEKLVEDTYMPQAGRDPLLAEAVRALPARRRLIVFLRYFADLPYSEIAALCGISEGTIAATLAQARAELLHMLPKEEYHDERYADSRRSLA